jgi:hypothetical protein
LLSGIAKIKNSANNICTMILIERLAHDFDEKATEMGVGVLANRAAVDPSAVWRLRNGQVKLLSKGVRRLCKAAGLDPDIYHRATSPRKSRKLMKALAETWDGTPEQADAICSVLRALQRVPRSRLVDNDLPAESLASSVKK